MSTMSIRPTRITPPSPQPHWLKKFFAGVLVRSICCTAILYNTWEGDVSLPAGHRRAMAGVRGEGALAADRVRRAMAGVRGEAILHKTAKRGAQAAKAANHQAVQEAHVAKLQVENRPLPTVKAETLSGPGSGEYVQNHVSLPKT